MRKGDDSKEEFIFLDGLDDEITTDQVKSSLGTDDYCDDHDKSFNEPLVVESIKLNLNSTKKNYHSKLLM